jgi:tetratricopeptide (TPR) repeat protein
MKAAGPIQEKDEQKAKLKQAAEYFKQAQAQLRKAQTNSATASADYEVARQLFDKAIAERPNHSPYYVKRGKCFRDMGQYQRALFDFSFAVRAEPTNAYLYGQRGHCFRKLGRIQEALKDYDEALRQDKDKAEHHYERALVFIDLEQFKEAIKGLEDAIERRLSTPYKAWFHLGICHRKLNEFEKSVEKFKQAISLDPANAEAHNHLGLSHVELHSYEDAKKCFASAVEHDRCARYLDNHGLASYHLGQFEESIEDFSAALELVRDIPPRRYQLCSKSRCRRKSYDYLSGHLHV